MYMQARINSHDSNGIGERVEEEKSGLGQEHTREFIMIMCTILAIKELGCPVVSNILNYTCMISFHSIWRQSTFGINPSF
jgi:hypothetical protein